MPGTGNVHSLTQEQFEEYKALVAQREHHKAQKRDYDKTRRDRAKVAEGLDPNTNRRSIQRPDETAEVYALRMKRNDAYRERECLKQQAVKNGTWVPKPKLTRAEKLRKRADQAAARRAAKKATGV